MKHKHAWKFQANVIVELPAEAFHRVNKTLLRKSSARIMGVNWEGVLIAYCDCGATTKDLTVLV